MKYDKEIRSRLTAIAWLLFLIALGVFAVAFFTLLNISV